MATNSSKTIIIINNIEIFHLFFTLNVFVWMTFVLILIYGIYHIISNKCLLKALLLGGEDQQTSHLYSITIIASEPTLAYDYDNSSIRIDINDENESSIASLLMRPLWAFFSIQPKPNSNPLWRSPKEEEGVIYGETERVNLSREVPLIGIYKMITERNLKKIRSIVMAHNCPDVNASLLVRCVEITNLSSLISHNYPLNVHISHLSRPISFSYDGYKDLKDFEFDSEDLSPRAQYQRNSSLNSIERASFWLLSFNLISFGSYFWSQSYDYETDEEWLMWFDALLLSVIIGGVISVFHLIYTLIYRLFKEYNLWFSETVFVKFIKRFAIWTALIISLILLIANLVIASTSIRSTIFLRWYRIAFLSALVFIVTSALFAFFTVFIHIKPKLRNENSFDASTLKFPKEGEPPKKYEMIVQNCTELKIKNLPDVPIFGSAWLKSALVQHQGLERAILCDVYDVTLFPKGELTTNLAENAIKLFGKENATNRATAYATRFIEQKGMAVSVSQYGHKKNDENIPKKDKEVLNIENKQEIETKN